MNVIMTFEIRFWSLSAQKHGSYLVQLRNQGFKEAHSRWNHIWMRDNRNNIQVERAERGLSGKFPGLKYAFVYRDNWTRDTSKDHTGDYIVTAQN